MDSLTRIEHALQVAVATGEVAGCPPKLAAALRHAVFPGGARIRPQLCIAVARACGDTDPALADAAAVAKAKEEPGWVGVQFRKLVDQGRQKLDEVMKKTSPTKTAKKPDLSKRRK